MYLTLLNSAQTASSRVSRTQVDERCSAARLAREEALGEHLQKVEVTARRSYVCVGALLPRGLSAPRNPQFSFHSLRLSLPKPRLGEVYIVRVYTDALLHLEKARKRRRDVGLSTCIDWHAECRCLAYSCPARLPFKPTIFLMKLRI